MTGRFVGLGLRIVDTLQQPQHRCRWESLMVLACTTSWDQSAQTACPGTLQMRPVSGLETLQISRIHKC